MKSTFTQIKKTLQIHKKQVVIFSVVMLILLIFVEPAYAGPGGFVAKGLFKTWYGKILGFALAIILLPLIIYVRFKEYFSVKQNQKTLAKLGTLNADFSWSSLQKNVRNVYSRVYIAWSNENMEEASAYVTSWYRQNQQLVVLDEWKSKNLKNICKLQEIVKVSPLHIEITSRSNFEGSRIAFLITATIEDYLINRETQEIVYGEKGFHDEEKIWFLEYHNGSWVLDEIRESDLSLALAKMKNIIPAKIANTINEKQTI